MPCKKTELVSAINSFAAARSSGDATLIQYSGQLVGQFLETLEFASEENDDQPEQSS